MNKTGSFIVSWDFSSGKDTGVLIVGKKMPGKDVVVTNAFQGKEALELYQKLTTVKKKENR